MKRLSHNEIASLFVKAQKGDSEAFEEFYAATYTAQYLTALRMLKSEGLAEDAVEEMYISLYKTMDTVRNPQAIVQFMNRITHACCVSIIKKENITNRSDMDDVMITYADPKPTPEEVSRKKSDIELLNMSLHELNPTLTSVLIKRYGQDMKIGDIAEEMNLSKRTVIRHIKKGVVEMRKIMEKLKNSTLSLFIFAEPFVAKAFRNANADNYDQISKSYSNVANAVGITTKAQVATAGVVGTATPILLSTKILIGGAVAFTGAVGGNVILMPQYQKTVSDLVNYTSQPITVSYTSTGANPIQEIQVYDSTGELVTNALSDDLTISMIKNDTYTIRVIGENGFSTSSKLTVNNLDNVSPDVSSITDDGVTVRLALYDSQSGIDWSKLSVVDTEGHPIDYWLEENMICFSNDIHYASVYVVDYCNNENTIAVSN